MNTDVIVYTTNDCIECTFVKQILTQEGITFVTRDLSVNPEYQIEVEKYGFLGVPVIVYKNWAIKGVSNELKDIIELVKADRESEN